MQKEENKQRLAIREFQVLSMTNAVFLVGAGLPPRECLEKLIGIFYLVPVIGEYYRPVNDKRSGMLDVLRADKPTY